MADRKKLTNEDVPPATDVDALAKFFDEHDLTDFEWEEVKVEVARKSDEVRVDVRLPQQSVDSLRLQAKQAGMPYKEYVKMILQKASERKPTF